MATPFRLHAVRARLLVDVIPYAAPAFVTELTLLSKASQRTMSCSLTQLPLTACYHFHNESSTDLFRTEPDLAIFGCLRRVLPAEPPHIHPTQPSEDSATASHHEHSQHRPSPVHRQQQRLLVQRWQ